MIDKVKNSFKKIYAREADFLVKAPGRINLIGEHTDYNGGLVFPAAIDKCMYFAFAKNDSKVGNVYAVDLEEKATIDLEDLQKTNSIWLNYIVGLLLEFQNKGLELNGFDCVFSSDIPMGAGMSSSAALECGFAMGMDHIIGADLGNWEMIDMSHHSNHTFMNIQGGIMDQFSSLFGKKDKCLLLNCSDRSFGYHDIDLKDYTIVLFNTNLKHEHTSSGYNNRASECKQIEELLQVHDPQIKSISEANEDMIEKIGSDWPQNLKDRANFVIAENKRVVAFSKVMKHGNVDALGELLYQSHHGLQHLYKVSCPELDLLVDLTRDIKEVLGARMMGGGFGGCTINLIKSDRVEAITQDIMSMYKDALGIDAESYLVKISEGAKVLLF